MFCEFFLPKMPMFIYNPHAYEGIVGFVILYIIFSKFHEICIKYLIILSKLVYVLQVEKKDSSFCF